jgi:hypothetical protein
MMKSARTVGRQKVFNQGARVVVGTLRVPSLVSLQRVVVGTLRVP